MRYSVNWTDDALDTLAVIWMQSPDPGAVTWAQATIDRLLASDPLRHGVPWAEGLYAIEVHPLRVQFEVFAGNRAVRVVSVGELP
jgi:hypothetical protein